MSSLPSRASTALVNAPRRRAPRAFLVGWALASVIGILWALATPIGDSPDEPAHLVKAASVARGQLVGEPAAFGHVVQAPRYIADTHEVACLVFDEQATADCFEDTVSDPGELVDAGTSAGLYNPVYYAVVGWPSLIFNDVAGIYAMRIVSALLAALFLGFTAQFAFELGRRNLTLAAVGLAYTPTLAFLSGAVNPNAVEVTATLATFMAMLAIVRRGPGAPLGYPLAVAVVSAATGAQMRGLSPLWIALALALPLILVPWSRLRTLFTRRMVWGAVAVIVLAAALATTWTLGSSSLTTAVDEEWDIPPYPGTGSSPLTGFVVMLLDTIRYGQQMVGTFGWLTTPAPDPVYFVWSAFTGTLVLAAIGLLRGRQLVFAAVVLSILVLLPPLVQAAYVTSGGYIWQGRYTLPLFALAMVGVAVVLGERLGGNAADGGAPTRADSRVSAAMWVGWALAQAYCLAVVLKRNASGENGTWGELLRASEWSAPGGNLTLLVVYAVVIAATAFLAWWTTARIRRTRAAVAQAGTGRPEEVRIPT